MYICCYFPFSCRYLILFAVRGYVEDTVIDVIGGV